MKDGGGSESGEIGENVPFPLLSLREKKGYIYRSSTKARWLDRCCGPGMAFKHKRFAAVPVQSRVNVFRRLADAGRGGGGGGGGGGGRREERSVPAGIRGHCAGHLPVPFKRFIYTDAYADVPGEGTFGRRRRAEPSRRERFHRNRLFEFVEKKQPRERKKERIRPGLLFGKGSANRVPLGNREIASDRFPRPIRPISAHLNGHLLRG